MGVLQHYSFQLGLLKLASWQPSKSATAQSWLLYSMGAMP